MKTQQPNALLLAVADVIHDERLQRTASDRELKADIARARERIDEYGNVIETKFQALAHCMRDTVTEAVGMLDVKDGKDGAPGPAGPQGERGERGEAGLNGERGAAGERGERGERGETGMMGAQGERGEPGAAGAIGERGAAGERGERGEAGPMGPESYPGQARGLYQEGEHYRAMDCVSMGGCEWRAVKDDPSGPPPGDDWRQTAKQGKKGDKGERGAIGPMGIPGPQGASIADIEVKDWDLVVTLSNGAYLTCNLFTLFERYHREAA